MARRGAAQVTNLGSKWPTTAALAAVEWAGIRGAWMGWGWGDVDGFFTLTGACSVGGVVWMLAMRHQVGGGGGGQGAGGVAVQR